MGPHLCRASGALFVVFVSGHLLLHHVWPFLSQFHSPVQKWDTDCEESGELWKVKKSGARGRNWRKVRGKGKERGRKGERNTQTHKDHPPQSSIFSVYCKDQIHIILYL